MQSVVARLRRPWVLILLAVIGLAGALAALWLVAEARVRDGLTRWADSRRAEGWQLTYGDGVASGFPFQVRLTLDKPRLLIPTDPAKGVPGLVGLAAEADSADLVWSLLDPFAVRLDLPARTSLEARWPNGGRWQGAMAGGGTLSIGSGSDGQRLALTLTRPRLTATGQGADMTIDSVRLDVLRHADQSTDHLRPSLDIELALDGILAPEADPILAKPMGIALRATVMGALPPGPPAQVLSAWRDEGGTVEFHEARITSGVVKLTGSATLALDRQMRPQAAGTITALGFPDAIDRMMEAKMIEERDGKLAKLLLLALARQDADTGLPTLSVPVSIQNGWLSVGPSQLIAVKPIRF